MCAPPIPTIRSGSSGLWLLRVMAVRQISLLPRWGPSVPPGRRSSESRSRPCPPRAAQAGPEARSGYSVDGNAGSDRDRLHDERHAGTHVGGQDELLELREKQRPSGGGDDTPGTAEKRGTAQDDGRHGGQQVRLTLEGARCLHDAGQEQAAEEVEESGPHVCPDLVDVRGDSTGLRRGPVGPDRFETPAGARRLDDEPD